MNIHFLKIFLDYFSKHFLLKLILFRHNSYYNKNLLRNSPQNWQKSGYSLLRKYPFWNKFAFTKWTLMWIAQHNTVHIVTSDRHFRRLFHCARIICCLSFGYRGFSSGSRLIMNLTHRCIPYLFWDWWNSDIRFGSIPSLSELKLTFILGFRGQLGSWKKSGQ